ncbi:MAG: MazG nucleotide pyrophosphohydrolase domain-containing protein [Thermoplasmata archaeon]|jgi:NTP pyrophosphatase (non-canonical NTP hydrolase)
MEISDILEKMKMFYLEQDKKSGPLFLLSVLTEEVGELNKAVRNKTNVDEEIADVLFITLSISNLFNVNPENILIEKYLENPEKLKEKWKDLQ